MRRWLAFVLAAIPVWGQIDFTLSWVDGKCVGCKTAAQLGRIQFVSRNEAWAVGSSGRHAAGPFVVIHTKDAGRTWREVPQTRQYPGDPDGPPAFSFIDAARGWIAWWDPSDDPKIIRTRDGGTHWEQMAGEFQESGGFLQKIRFFDDLHGYGTAVTKFLRTSDGGRSWTQTEMPHVRFIDRMLFLTPDLGWLAGTDGKSVSVFRTTNGGRDWEESRTTPPNELDSVRDLFFLDKDRGWLITWHFNETYLLSTVDGGKNWMPVLDRSFQGEGHLAGVVRFVSDKNGFVFDAGDHNNLIYTVDGGANWKKHTFRQFVYDCQVFGGDLLCSGGFRILKVHPK
jgi:photosystem II stability/assembly factor-like uncharacterized protein